MQTNQNQGITSYKQFKIIAWGIISSNFVYLIIAYFISTNDSERNNPEFIASNSELAFWIVFLFAFILTLTLRQIMGNLMRKNPITNSQQYYGREIVKLVFLENISIFGLLFVIIAGFQWIYSLFFLTPIALMIKFFPSEYKEINKIN